MTASTALYGPQWSLGSWQGNWTDADDVEWWVSTEEGWSSSPGLRSDIADLPGADGGNDAASLYSARQITLSGTAIATTVAAAAAARLAFASTLEANRGGTLSCTENGLTLSALVRLTGPVRLSPAGANAFEFQLQLTAPDPRKYAPAVEQSVGLPLAAAGLVFPVAFPANFGATSGGSIALTNVGTVKSWPVLRIAGPVVNPRITNPVTGDSLRLAMSLDAGQYVDIDTAARTVLLMGSASRRALVSVVGEWLPVAPGACALAFAADTYDAGALLTVAARSAWI